MLRLRSERKRDDGQPEKEITRLYKDIWYHAGYAIISTDTQGIITSFNKASEQLLGYSSDDVVGKVTLEVFHLADEVLERAKKISSQINQNIKPGYEVLIIKSKRQK